MSAQPVDVLEKYGRLEVETAGDHVCIVDEETLSVTIADVRGPNAPERARVIVAALNQRAAVAELVEAHRDALAALDVLMEGWPKGAPVPAGWGGCCSAYDAGHAALAPFRSDEG